MKSTLSLIVAIYKVQAYIPELIESLIAGANTPCVQVIFVNDCTPDDSMLLCRELLRRHSGVIRFTPVLIDRETNGGLAAARNTGLSAANGAYIGFLDSDDAIDPAYYAVLGPLINEGRWDVVEFGYKEFARCLPPPGGHLGHCLPSSQLNAFYTGFFSWIRLYRRSIATGLSFPEGTIYEDIPFVSQALARAETSIRISNSLVFYRRRAGSITATRNGNYAHQMVNLLEGTTAALRLQKQPAKAVELTARKALLILLKGTRIKDASERARFFALCKQPLACLGMLIEELGWEGLKARLWAAGCRSWVSLQSIRAVR